MAPGPVQYSTPPRQHPTAINPAKSKCGSCADRRGFQPLALAGLLTFGQGVGSAQAAERATNPEKQVKPEIPAAKRPTDPTPEPTPAQKKKKPVPPVKRGG